MSRNRIKLLGVVPPPYGGVSVYVERLLYKLNIDGYQTGAYYIDVLPRTPEIDNGLFHKFTWLNTSKFLVRFPRLLRETRGYSIVHSHFSLEAMMYLWFLRRMTGKQIIVTVHNSMVANYHKNTNFINKFFLKLMSSSSVVWIAVSDNVKNEMLKLQLDFNEINVIPAFISPNVYVRDTTKISSKLRSFLNSEEKIITFYGHSFMRNETQDIYGYEICLNMFKKLTLSGLFNCKLLMCIAEANDQDRLNSLMDFSKLPELQNRIFWQVGPVDNMSEIWKATYIYVRPTSTDGDSVAIREALSFGCRVVASDVCERPNGVTVFNLNDLNDFENKVLSCRTEIRSSVNHGDFYDEMLSIYQSLFVERIEK
jgi:glycosyltransferase involved in cell wall biosynthesis